MQYKTKKVLDNKKIYNIKTKRYVLRRGRVGRLIIKRMEDELKRFTEQLNEDNVKQYDDENLIKKLNKKISYKKDEDLTLPDYINMFNNKQKLSEKQLNLFKQLLIRGYYLIKINVIGIEPVFMAASRKYVDKLINIMSDGYFLKDTTGIIKYSDQAYNFTYDEIESYELVDITPKSLFIEMKNNKDGAYFNYLNNTDLDLTRYQIIRKTDNQDCLKYQCLLHTLKIYGLSDSLINSVILSISSEGDQNISYISRSNLNKICDIIKHSIVIHLYENKFSEKKNIIKYGKKYDEQIHIGMYSNHYFIYEKTIYSKYFIDHYDELKNIDNCYDIIVKNGEYYKLGDQKCDSLYMIKKLYDNNHFIKDSSYLLNHCVNAKIINSIPLDNIQDEQEIFKIKNADDDLDRDIFYADCESDVSNNKHDVLMMGFVSRYNDDVITLKLDHMGAQIMVGRFLHKIKMSCKNKNKKSVPIIYFHNLKYDYMGLIKKYLIIKSETKKNNQIYSVNGLFLGFEYELRDSYKLINISLSKFPSTFGLCINKKEAIAYKFYNRENIILKKHSIEEYMNKFEKSSDKKLFLEILNNDKELFEYDDLGYFNAVSYYQHYLKYDCLVLKKGLEKYVEIISQITSTNNKEKLWLHSSLTISSLVNKYMSINGAFDNIYKVSMNLREYISDAIYGGRVNVCEQFKKQIINDDINDYDATSLYPSAIYRMCKEMGIPQGTAKKIINFNINDDYFICRFRINKINKKQQNPFIAIKTKAGIDYINEIIEPIIVTIDKITLEDYKEYHQIEYEFIDGVFWNEGFNKKMGDLIYELFDSRVSYKQQMKKLDALSNEYSKCNILQEIIKLMMNSSYGKTILKKSNDKSSFIYNTKKGDVENANIESYICNNFNTIKSYRKINEIQTEVQQEAIDTSFNLSHIGVLILSYSKRIMNEVMSVASDNNIDIYYQDTDSMHLKNKDISKLEQLFFNKYNRQIRGDNMGEFHSDFKLGGSSKKSQIISKKSIFLGKKSYIDVLQSENDKGENIQGYHMRMKGISESALQYACENEFEGDYFKLYEHLSITGNKQKFILNPYTDSVSFEYIPGGIRSRNYQEFVRIVSF